MKISFTPDELPPGWEIISDSEHENLPSGDLLLSAYDYPCWSANHSWKMGDNPMSKWRGKVLLATRIIHASPIPDSGTRTNFSTGAVRDAATGKGLFSRIPPIALRKLAIRFEDGSIKYPDGEHGPNWMRGIPLSRFFDAIQRHSISAAEGKTDEDHLGAVLWNASAWAWTENEINEGRLPVTLNDLPFHPAMVANRHIRDVFGPK